MPTNTTKTHKTDPTTNLPPSPQTHNPQTHNLSSTTSPPDTKPTHNTPTNTQSDTTPTTMDQPTATSTQPDTTPTHNEPSTSMDKPTTTPTQPDTTPTHNEPSTFMDKPTTTSTQSDTTPTHIKLPTTMDQPTTASTSDTITAQNKPPATMDQPTTTSTQSDTGNAQLCSKDYTAMSIPICTPESAEQAPNSTYSNSPRDPAELAKDCTLSIASLNIQNVKSNLQYLQTLLEEHDLICLQEHWLFNYEQNWINRNIPDLKVHIKSVDDDDPISHAQKIRGYGGIATVTNNQLLKDSLKQLPDGNTRIQVLELKHSCTTFAIVNCYMPCRNSRTGATDYDDALDALGEILTKYRDTHHILLAGDFNSSLTRNPANQQDKKLKQFIKDHSIHTDIRTDMPTFYHHNGKDHAQIDYILNIPPKENTDKTTHTHTHTYTLCIHSIPQTTLQ